MEDITYHSHFFPDKRGGFEHNLYKRRLISRVFVEIKPYKPQTIGDNEEKCMNATNLRHPVSLNQL